MFLKKKGWGRGLTIALVFTFLFQCFFMMAPEPASAATTELAINRIASDGKTIMEQMKVDYHFLEENLEVMGDGITHYYHQGPVFKDDSDPETQELLRWNQEEDTNWDTKDMGAVMGTNVIDLCDLLGGMAPGQELEIKASDGFKKTFAYKNVYEYDPDCEGPMVVCWYKDGKYPDTGYTDGMRLVWFAGATEKADGPEGPGSYHVFGNWDWHEAANSKYWYYYQGTHPTTTGLSVQNVAELNILTDVVAPECPVILTADTTDNEMGKAVDITFDDNPEWRDAIIGIKVGTKALRADEYTVTEGNINIAANVFTQVKDYNITVQTIGYKEAAVTQSILAADTVPLAIVVKENGTELQTINYNLNDWELERQYYSIKDSSGKYRFGAAEGVYLEDILNDAEIDIETINSFKFISSETPPFTASITSELLNEQRYYYPNIFSENKEDGAEAVKPMLAVKSYVGDRDVSTLPSWDSIDDENTIRLFFGQKNVDDVNYSSFAKLVCRIEVEVTETSGPVAVTGVSITEGDQELEVDETVQLHAVVAPENATNKSVTWSSSDDTIATVSETGLVTAVEVGTTDITVTTEDGSKTDSITVTVAEGSGGSTIDVLFEGTVSLTPDETFTVTVGTNQYTIDENTPLGALQAAADANSFTYVLSDKRWSYDQVLLLDDVGEYVRKSPGYWYAYVNDVYKDGYQNTPAGLNVIELVDGDQVEFYYAADISDATDLNAVKAAATAAVKTIASIEVPSTMDVLYEGTVSLTPDETFTVTVGTNQYTIDENTPLGALHAASVANDFTYVASDKKWGESGILLLDDIGPYPYQKNGNRWFAYVNGVFKDGYDATADALNIIELADGDTVEYYYVHKDTDKNDLNAVKAAATAAVKTVASISTIDVLYDGTVALDPDETFTVTIGSNQYTIDQNTPLGALHAAALAQGFTYLASDKKWSENELLLLDDIGDYPYQKNGNRWFAYVNDVFKDGFADADDALNVVELFEGDKVEFYYANIDSSDLNAVKAAATAAVKTVAATGVAPTEWTLQLSGARDENVTRAYFEDGLACASSSHHVTWTDSEGNVWGGVPLWLLVGMVDDNPDIGNKHFNFNAELAAAGYEVKVIAGDGWSTVLDSADIAGSDAYIVANTLNGEPLPLKTESNKGCWPLQLKGSAIAGGQQVGNIVRIELSGLPEPPAGWTLELIGDIGDTITQEEFEDGIACVHNKDWTDVEDNEWSGIPLWVLLGAVDDIEQTGNHWTFNSDLAADYTVKLVAGDGFSKTLDGADVANSDDYIVANKCNGEPLTEDSAPLRLVGDGVTKPDGSFSGTSVGNLVRIEIPELQTPPAAEGSWNLSLKGKISDVMSQTELEQGIYCPNSGHLVEWTDGNGDKWSGMPLWLLAGWVDDRKPHSYDFVQASAGYKVVVKASDGYSFDFDSKDINKSDDYIIANKLNGEPLTDSWPLRLVGPGVATEDGSLTGKSVGSIEEIKLTSFETGGSGTIPELRIVKYGEDGTTIIAEETLTYLDMMEQFDVIGDGTTVYKYQGITNIADDIWSADDETVGGFKIENAIMGTRVSDLVSLVGDMGTGTDITFVAEDGWETTLPYSSIYPDPSVFERQGDAVIAWYADGKYVPDYKDGMRLFFTPEDHIYGQWDMHETLPEAYWHYYYGDVMYPSCAGLSPKYITEIRVYSVPQGDWTLELDGLDIGGLQKEISKTYFESALTCTFGADHKKSYTDSKNRTWEGMPLWLLVGFVDDEDQHSDNAFNAALAQSGAYQVVLTADDGHSVTIDSTEIARNNNYIVANTLDGLLISETDDNWPLKLVGPSATGSKSIGNIVSIELIPLESDNPIYTISPVMDSTYAIGQTPAGIKTMTVNAGNSGFNYFTVNIEPVVSHSGNETVVFTHMRNGSQLQINSARADFDQVGTAQAGFNVKAGDIIRVYIVDELTNAVDHNPVILQ